MRNSFFVLWIIFICSCSVVFAQRQEIDSLKKVLPKYAETDTNYINTLNELALKYRGINPDTMLILVEKSIFLANKSRFTKGRVNALINKGLVYYVKGDYAQALHMYYEALLLAEEISYKKGIGNLYNDMANIYSDQGKYLEALENYFKSLQIREEIGDKKGVAASFNNIANVYTEQGKYPEALENHFKSLKIKKEIRDKKGISASFNNIAIIYKKRGKYPEALENFVKSLKISEEIGNKQGIAYNLNNIASVYTEQGKYPEALESHFESLKIKKEIGDKEGISSSVNNIASIYEKQGKYAEALENYFKSLKIKEEIGDKQEMAISKNGIAKVYLALKNYTQALQYAQEGLETAKETGQKVFIRDLNESLSQIYEATGKTEQALFHYKQFKSYADSLNNKESEKKTATLQAQYEFDNKAALMQAEQTKRDIEQEKQRQQLYWLIFSALAGLVSLSIILFLIFRSRKKIQNAYSELTISNVQVQQAKQAIEVQAEELREANEEVKSVNANLEKLVDERTANLKQAYADVAKINTELDTFLYRSSHDLRRPLTTLMGLNTLAQMNIEGLSARDLFEKVNTTAINMDKMLGKLRMIHYINNFVIEPESIDFEAIRQELIEKLAYLTKQHQVEWRTSIEPHISLKSSAILLEYILHNLIENALIYAQFSKAYVKIEISTHHNNICLQVSDNGQGIDSEYFGKLFDMFYKANERSQGNGLGLYVVKRATDKLKGSIEFESELNKGSIFKITIPC